MSQVRSVSFLRAQGFVAVAIAMAALLIMVEICGADAATTFSYQGRLTHAGVVAEGAYDFTFLLYSNANGGVAASNPVLRENVGVTNGLFTVLLDFGAQHFTGLPCWLEVLVRSNGFAGAYTVLQPRQALTATPFAIAAQTLAGALPNWGLAGTYTNPVTLQNSNNVFFGLYTGNGAGLTGIAGTNLLANSITPSQIDSNAWKAATNQSVPVINVKEFGAYGDGIHDDTVAISNAWNQFIQQGGTLFFPPGTYLDSGTHSSLDWNTPGIAEGYNGRRVQGGGNAIWRYTGSQSLIFATRSCPDFVGIKFLGNSSATNAIYISTIWNKVIFEDCMFENWTGAAYGALTMDEADSVTLRSVMFYNCDVGLGLGYRCHHLKADIQTRYCRVGVACGVPTRNFPGSRESFNVNVNMMAIYCGTGFAIDGGCTATVSLYSWWNTNAPLAISCIPGISTNYCCASSLNLHDSFFTAGNPVNSQVHLWGAAWPALRISKCRFNTTASSPAVVRSHSLNADVTRLSWEDNLLFHPSTPWFQKSTGALINENAQDQDRHLNKTVGIYNTIQQTGPGGTGYLLDVIDSYYSGGGAGPIGRIGHSRGAGDLNDFWGGLTVRYEPAIDLPAVTVTNADLYVVGARPGNGSPGGQLFLSGRANATNGFAVGPFQGLTTNISFNGSTLIFRGGILVDIQ